MRDRRLPRMLFFAVCGLASSAAVLSADALASASPVSLLTSALLGAGVGFLATGVALYAAGRRAINRQISDERAQLASQKPLWRLLGIDFLILATVAAVEWYQRRHGGLRDDHGGADRRPGYDRGSL